MEANLDGKRCPCIDGYVCKKTTNTCVARDPGLIQTFDFQAAWATANQVMWKWSVQGKAEDLVRYEILIAKSKSELDAGQGVRFGPEQNPELGRFTLPHTEAANDVVSTLTDGLEPSTSYVARLFAVDRTGYAAPSDAAFVTTGIAATVDVPLFTDTQPIWVGPNCVQTTSEAPLGDAGQHLQYEVSCAAGGVNQCDASVAPSCWSAPVFGFTADFTGLDEGNFVYAFVEFALAIESPNGIYWGGVSFGDDTEAGYSMQPVSFRANGEYRVYQLKLSEFAKPTDALSLADVPNLSSFGVGGELPAGSVQRLDNVRIRW